MSLTTHRGATTTDRMGFMADERKHLAAWADENGLEVALS